MATQFLVAIAVGVCAGKKLDKWIGFTRPFSIWLLPLPLITGVIVIIIRDISTPK